MFREIKKRQIILEGRKPYRSEIAKYIQELNLLDWVQSSMQLDGAQLSRSQAERILKGEYLENASLIEHAVVQQHCRMFQYAQDMLRMAATFDGEMLRKFQSILSEESHPGYRRNNPILIPLDYNPPHPSEIEEQLELMMHWFYSEDLDFNPIAKAVRLHHRIIEIYPFEEHSEAVARAAMHYHLMKNGFPSFVIGLSEQRYNGAVSAYLKKEDIQPFYQVVLHDLFQKMEILIQLTMN